MKMTVPEVLVVEDEKIVAADIRENLRSLGYSVPAVISSGEEAITEASQNHPDLVLMDIQLKGRIDGIEAARLVQGRLNIPVVFITAFADDATIQRAKSTDPYGYIVKPFGKKELQTTIEIALHKHRSERRLRTSEEWLMSLIKGMGEAILAVDRAGSICLMNPAAETITGGSLEETLGAHWTDVIEFTGRQRSGLGNPFLVALEEGKTVHLPECPVRFARTGKKAILAGSVAPLLAHSSGVSGAVFAFQDQTEQQRLERQYQRTRHLEALQTLAGGVAHNLNNVLMIIYGYSEALIRNFTEDDPAHRDVRMIQKATERASAMTHQLLSFSRRQAADPKVISINDIVSHSEPMMRHVLGDNIALTINLDPEAGKAEVDPVHLEQVLMSLVLNARDSMPLGGAISVRTAKVDVDLTLASKFVDLLPGWYVCLELADSGAGIDYAVQSQLFEPFFTTKERTKGLGLGLAAAYGMVKQAGGNIWFESEPGKGTRFSVYLPRAEERSIAPAAISSANRGSETILVVEDEPDIRLLIRETLLHLGYRVLEANGGGEALKICDESDDPIHLVVADILMPVMSGPELASRLTSVTPKTRVLFVSSYSQYVLEHHGALEHGTSILQKPFTAEALAVKIREILDGEAEGGRK